MHECAVAPAFLCSNEIEWLVVNGVGCGVSCFTLEPRSSRLDQQPGGAGFKHGRGFEHRVAFTIEIRAANCEAVKWARLHGAPDHLQCHRALQAGLPGPVDDPHGATGDLLLDLVIAEGDRLVPFRFQDCRSAALGRQVHQLVHRHVAGFLAGIIDH